MDAEILLARLEKNKLSLGSIESITGGLFSSEIASIPGASKVLKGAIVSYSIEEKIKLVGVSSEVIDKYGVVSKQTADEMALKGAKKLNVDICVSCTGNAGPSVCSDGKLVGKVFISVFYKGKVSSYELNLKGERNEIRSNAVACMIDYVYFLIEK